MFLLAWHVAQLKNGRMCSFHSSLKKTHYFDLKNCGKILSLKFFCTVRKFYSHSIATCVKNILSVKIIALFGKQKNLSAKIFRFTVFVIALNAKRYVTEMGKLVYASNGKGFHFKNSIHGSGMKRTNKSLISNAMHLHLQARPN